MPGFQNYTGRVESDMLRLNLAIPPTKQPNDGGTVAGDAAGFPNGRRISDDVVVKRPTPGGQVPLLVFPEVEEGNYELGLKEKTDDVRLTVSVIAGESHLGGVAWLRFSQRGAAQGPESWPELLQMQDHRSLWARGHLPTFDGIPGIKTPYIRGELSP